MQKCAHCGSPNTQTGVDRYHCSDCGENTFYTGEAVPKDERTVPNDLNEPLVQDYAPHGNPAGSSRTPDGVADPGTNLDGPVPKNQAEAVKSGEQRDDDKMKGVPEPPPDLDDRPTSMQTEHSTRNPELERSDVHEDDPQGHDMQDVGGFGATPPEEETETTGEKRKSRRRSKK